MTDFRAAWLIGSQADMPAENVAINGTDQPVTVRGRYLYDATASFSCIALMQNLMTAGGLAGVNAYLQKNGYVYIEANAVFTVSWGVTANLRDILGFEGNLSGAASYTATLKSPLLWMPGKPETPMGQRLAHVGHKVHTMYQSVSAYTGRAESVSHGTRTYARYMFPMVDTELVVTTANAGGTFGRWWDEVAVTSARWKLYRDVIEGPSNTSSALTVLDEPLGPYVVSGQGGKGPSWAFDPSKGFERTDARADIDIRAHVVEEYT
jgi:hypothetical protein